MGVIDLWNKIPTGPTIIGKGKWFEYNVRDAVIDAGLVLAGAVTGGLSLFGLAGRHAARTGGRAVAKGGLGKLLQRVVRKPVQDTLTKGATKGAKNAAGNALAGTAAGTTLVGIKHAFQNIAGGNGMAREVVMSEDGKIAFLVPMEQDEGGNIVSDIDLEAFQEAMDEKAQEVRNRLGLTDEDGTIFTDHEGMVLSPEDYEMMFNEGISSEDQENFMSPEEYAQRYNGFVEKEQEAVQQEQRIAELRDGYKKGDLGSKGQLSQEFSNEGVAPQQSNAPPDTSADTPAPAVTTLTPPT